MADVAIDDAGTDRARARDIAATRRRRRVWLTVAIRIVSVAAVLALWQFVGSAIDPVLFTTPNAVARAGYRMIVSGELWNYLWPSLVIFAVGLTIAAVIGVTTGLLLARFWVIDVAFGVYITFLYSIPAVALVPLIVLWAGFESTAKIIVLFLFGFFPMAINTSGREECRSAPSRGRPRIPLLGAPTLGQHRATRRAAVHRHRPATRCRARVDRHGAGRPIHRDFRHRISDRAYGCDVSG